MKVAIENWTSDKAQKLLEASESAKVRAIARRRVERYATVMKNGGWKLVGQGISIDPSGKLIDGFHRLSAIATLNGKDAVPLLTSRGVSPDDVMVIDAGLKRRLPEFLKVQGHKNAKLLAAAAAVLFDIRNNQLGAPFFMKKELMTIGDGLTVVRSGGKKLEAALKIYNAMPPKIRSVASGGLQSVMFYLAGIKMGEDTVTDWVEKLSRGTDLSATHPIHRLRELHFSALRQSKGAGVSMRVRMALYIKAWNAWVAGDEVKVLYWRAVGKRAEAFPQPYFGE